MPSLVVESGPNKGVVYDLCEPSISVGRDPSNAVQLPSDAVSRIHARIESSGKGWVLHDCGSRNGTRVNGKPVATVVLAHGDEIVLGETSLRFIEADTRPVPAEELSDTTTLEVREELSPDAIAQLKQPPPEKGSKAPRLAALLEVSRLVSVARSIGDLFSAITEVVEKHLKPHRTVPILFDESRGMLRPWVKEKSGFYAHLARLPISSTIVSYVQDRRSAVLSQSTAEDRRFRKSRSIVEHRITSALCAPLCIGDKLLGVLYADRLGDAKPFKKEDLELLTAIATQAAVGVENARFHAQTGRERQVWDREVRGRHNLIGESPAIEEVFRFIARAAPSEASVLIEGESGTGKELVARAIHYNSPRQRQPFEAVNCAAMAPGLVESELFGHVKGAFTGADSERPGRFELADGGSLFLDECGELPESTQSKLLRVLEQGEVRRLGDVRDRPVNVRLIAATNKSLRARVESAEFREDLYFRLNVLQVVLPPLRERAQDTEILAAHFLEHFCKKCGRPPMQLAPEVLALLKSYPWPGNIRELKNVIERMVVMAEGPELALEDVPYDLRGQPAAGSPAAADPLRSLAELEREHIDRVLAHTGGNKKEAARLLGIDRSTLYAKLKAHQL